MNDVCVPRHNMTFRGNWEFIFIGAFLNRLDRHWWIGTLTVMMMFPLDFYQSHYWPLDPPKNSTVTLVSTTILVRFDHWSFFSLRSHILFGAPTLHHHHIALLSLALSLVLMSKVVRVGPHIATHTHTLDREKRPNIWAKNKATREKKIERKNQTLRTQRETNYEGTMEKKLGRPPVLGQDAG